MKNGDLQAPRGRRLLAVAVVRSGVIWGKGRTLSAALRAFNGTTVKTAKVYATGPKAHIEGTWLKDSGGSTFLGKWVRK